MPDIYEWSALRHRAVEAFGGDYPAGPQEQEIIDAFELDPVAVQAAVDKVGERYKQGKVRIPWAVLRKEAEQIRNPPSEVTASDESSREKAIVRAESWLRVAGLHFDREQEVAAHLYGHHGPLEHFPEDEVLQLQMLSLWRKLRPEGERGEAEAQDRADKLRAFRKIPDWTPPKRMETLLERRARTRGVEPGRCEDCRKDGKERIVYGTVTICRECAGKRDVRLGFAVLA
jgi:hypothetical protein